MTLYGSSKQTAFWKSTRANPATMYLLPSDNRGSSSLLPFFTHDKLTFRCRLRSARQSIGGASSGVPLNEGLLLEHMQSSLTPKKRGRPPLVRSHQETDAEHDSESDTEYEPRPKLKFKHPRTSAYTAPPEIASSSRHQVGSSPTPWRRS